jgi:hypothetical protein
MGGRRSPARSAPVSPAPPCAMVNIVELEEEAGSLWRRRRVRWEKGQRGRWGREEVPCLQIRCRRFGVWSVLVLVAALERWGAEVGSGPAAEVGSGSRPRWGAVRRPRWGADPASEVGSSPAGGGGGGGRRGGGVGGDRGGSEERRGGGEGGGSAEVAVSLQCSGEERESPGMGGEGAVTAKRGKGSSSC